MRKARTLGVCLAAGWVIAASARADVWDLGSDNDDDLGSDNELVHGLRQVHDLAMRDGKPDADHYPLRIAPAHSFEVIVDGHTGDVSAAAGTPRLEALGASGGIVATSRPVTSFGIARSLRLVGPPGNASTELELTVRVSGAACGTGCTSSDQYRIRAYDTTLVLPRFNNTNGQATVLIVQNTGGDLVTGQISAFDNSGVFVSAVPLSIGPFQTLVGNLSTVVGGALAARSGSLVIRHDGRYGALHGKGVALEPATGFTFDTALSYVAN